MTEWIVSSSILILIVIALRTVFKGKISLRLQYAIWGLVLLRLLIPFNFGSTNMSVANLTSQTAKPATIIQTTAPNINVPEELEVQTPHAQPNEMQPQQSTQTDPVNTEKDFDPSAHTIYIVWASGFIFIAGMFLFTNLRFKRRIMDSRYGLDVRKNNLDVYATGEIDTPCLFGIRNPAIYVTYPVADNQTLLRHTLEHEATHYRHGDHIWAVLRCVCLAIHWYNPLVWWAAFLSQRDAELACDEATIKRLGEGERAEYGRTLIGMTCQKKANVLITAITMTASISGIKERIMLIAKRPKMALYTLIAVILVASIAVGCTFTGAKKAEEDTAKQEYTYYLDFLTEEELERIEQGEMVLIGGVDDYILAYRSVNGPQLALYRAEADGDILATKTYAVGEHAVSGGLSVNYITDGDKHIYFGTFNNRHRVSEDDSRIYLDWEELVFYDAQGDSHRVDLVGKAAYLCIIDSPASDFDVVVKGGTVAMTMDEYLEQGYAINEVNWCTTIPLGNATLTEDDTSTKPEETDPPSGTIVLQGGGTLYGELDDSKVCIAVLPTGISMDGGDYYYIIPEDQTALLEYYTAANAAAHTYTKWDSSNRRAGWWIVYQGQWWQVTEGGAMFGTDPETWDGICIDADDAKELYEFCDAAVRETGIGEPVRPEDITEIKSATLYWNGVHTVTDEYALNKIEKWIANSGEEGSVSCWFTAQLVLELENGETKTIAMATDSCTTWMSEGVAYGFGEITEEGIKGNEEFYSLFAPAVIRERIREGGDVMTDIDLFDYLTYLNWSRYANQYGADETFTLMDKIGQWAAEEPTFVRFGGVIGWTIGLDGAYADYYAGMLARLYELAPSEFAWACLGNATDEQEERTLSMLAYHWNMTPEEVRTKLEAEIPQN